MIARTQTLLLATAIAVLCAAPAAAQIGPAPEPGWAADYEVKLGWIFADPLAPETESPLADWDTAVGPPPVWDYDATRIAYTFPAQWHTVVPHTVNGNQMQHFWISWVYEFSPVPLGESSLYTSIVPTPFSSYQNFSFTDEWFLSDATPTTDAMQAVYGRWTAQLEMWPSPDSVELFLGTARPWG